MGMRLCRGSLCQCDMHADDGSGADEEEDLKPAAKHGWNEDEPQADATPEAGPQGRASQTAAAQASLRPLLDPRCCFV